MPAHTPEIAQPSPQADPAPALWVGPDAADHRPLLDRILASRGLDGPNAPDFLKPSLKHLHEPSLLPGVDLAAQRILDAARARRHIVIYGDYDVDGISASAILFHTLRLIAPDAPVRCYVPHRMEEGYGLNAAAILDLAADGASLIVTVDCGITAVEPARVARQAGVELIITDHHCPAPGPLPDAHAIVHPALPGSTYPFPHLCGAAVAYKLAWRLCTLAAGSERVPAPCRELLLELLALASLGVVADVVPLVGEHRVIARFGLSMIRASRFEGLRALVEASGLAGDKIAADDVGFRLGPRLNACGRLGHAGEAVELLTTATGGRAHEIAHALSAVNERRRAAERAIFDQACALAEQAGMTAPDSRAIVLAHDDWHPGVVGIVCSKLVERYRRPTILLGRRGEHLQGSGRSIEGFHLADALAACSRHTIKAGGHAMAAGLHLHPDRLHDFTADLRAHAAKALDADALRRRIHFDALASIHDLTPQFLLALNDLAPFGQGNPSVRLLLRGVAPAQVKPIGDRGKHLALFVRHPADPKPARELRVLAWDWAPRAHLFNARTIDCLIAPKFSTWNGTTSVEAELVDARPA